MKESISNYIRIKAQDLNIITHPDVVPLLKDLETMNKDRVKMDEDIQRSDDDLSRMREDYSEHLTSIRELWLEIDKTIEGLIK